MFIVLTCKGQQESCTTDTKEKAVQDEEGWLDVDRLLFRSGIPFIPLDQKGDPSDEGEERSWTLDPEQSGDERIRFFAPEINHLAAET